MTRCQTLCVFGSLALLLAAFAVPAQASGSKKGQPMNDGHKADTHHGHNKDSHKPDAHSSHKKDTHKPTDAKDQVKTHPQKTAAPSKKRGQHPAKLAPPAIPNLHLHHALWELREARRELEVATTDFAGLKPRAHHAINAALHQLGLTLEYNNDNTRGMPTRGDFADVYKKYPRYPHLHHALDQLRQAHHQLKADPNTFNGHKEAALRELHRAALEIELLLQVRQ